MARYREIQAWQLCHELFLKVHAAAVRFPREERFELSSQLRHAAFSAAANIVEGAAKRGPREFRRFLDISLGSLAEVEYALQSAKDLNYLSSDQWTQLNELATRAGKCTFGLYRSVKRD